MDHMPPPIVYAPHADSPRSRSLIAAAVLCFAGTLVPLAWLAIQLANARTNEVLATFSGARLPFGLLLLENAASALALCGLLILAGVLLCHRARWAIHVTSALMGIVLVGATGATLAEAVRRFSDDSPMPKPMGEHVVEIALRAVTGVLWPLAVVLLLSRRRARAAIVASQGSMPKQPVLLFVAGAVLMWLGLATTSLSEQGVPIGIYFGQFHGGSSVTLWRVGFAAAWLLAGVLLLVRAPMLGWLLGLLATLAAIASEAMLAAMGGSGALDRGAVAGSLDGFRASIALANDPNAPWLAALFRSATFLCLLGLLLLAAQHFLFEDVPEPLEREGGTERSI